MYKINCILRQVVIDYPTCMYKIKNMYGDENESECVSQFQKSPILLDIQIYEQIQNILKKTLPEMEVLEIRQQEILQKLEELKLQLTVMNSDLKLCNKPDQRCVTTQTFEQREIDTTYLQEIVINVNPENIPYSLLAIKNLWSKRIDVVVECFTHSSISKLSQEAKDFQEIIVCNNNCGSVGVKLKVILIWKNILGNTEMNCSPKVVVPIYGEANILRFLSRIGPNELNYENCSNVNEIDSVLDLCYELANQTSVKVRQNLIRSLSSRLGKSEYYCNNLSIGDIAVSSVIKQHILIKDLTLNMDKWFQRVTCAVY